MNEVLVIYDLYHDSVGIAADYKSAIHYLIEEGWIGGYTDITNENDNLISLADAFGEDWQIVLLNADEDWFNDKFVDQFGLGYMEIYKHE